MSWIWNWDLGEQNAEGIALFEENLWISLAHLVCRWRNRGIVVLLKCVDAVNGVSVYEGRLWRAHTLRSPISFLPRFSYPKPPPLQRQTIPLIVSKTGNCSIPSLIFQLRPTDHGTRHAVVVLPAEF